MKNLIKFKKELEKRQEDNEDLIAWATTHSTDQCVEKLQICEQECNYILYMIDKFIRNNEEKPKKTRRKKNESMSDVPMVSVE